MIFQWISLLNFYLCKNYLCTYPWLSRTFVSIFQIIFHFIIHIHKPNQIGNHPCKSQSRNYHNSAPSYQVIWSGLLLHQIWTLFQLAIISKQARKGRRMKWISCGFQVNQIKEFFKTLSLTCYNPNYLKGHFLSIYQDSDFSNIIVMVKDKPKSQKVWIYLPSSGVHTPKLIGVIHFCWHSFLLSGCNFPLHFLRLYFNGFVQCCNLFHENLKIIFTLWS